MTTVILSGLPGVGKSTTLARVTELRPSITVVSIGAVIREVAASAASRGDVRMNLTDVVTAAVVRDAKAEVVRRVRERPEHVTLLDSHTSTIGEFSVRLTPDQPDYLRAIDLAGVVVLAALNEVILARRTGDPDNPRLGDAAALDVLSTVVISSLVAVCTNAGRPLHVVSATGTVDDVAGRVLRALDDIVSWNQPC